MASSRSVLRKRVLYRSLSDHFLINKEAILSRETKAALLYMPSLALKFFTTRSRMVRDWAKSSGGGGGGGPEHLEMWLLKNTWPTPRHFGTKMTDPPLKQGWKLHDPPPS